MAPGTQVRVQWGTTMTTRAGTIGTVAGPHRNPGVQWVRFKDGKTEAYRERELDVV